MKNTPKSLVDFSIIFMKTLNAMNHIWFELFDLDLWKYTKDVGLQAICCALRGRWETFSYISFSMTICKLTNICQLVQLHS